MPVISRAFAPGSLPRARLSRRRGCDAPRAAVEVPPSPAERLRRSLAKPGCVVMPACYDALGAKLIARSGAFECAFMSGYGVSASRLGDPDVGLASSPTSSTRARTCAGRRATSRSSATATRDSGGAANVRRTVESFHRAGFAAVTIEDQVFPKRCAFAGGVRVVSRAESLARLRAAPTRGTTRARARRRRARRREDGQPPRVEHTRRPAEAMWEMRGVPGYGRGRGVFRGTGRRERDGDVQSPRSRDADDPRAGGKTRARDSRRDDVRGAGIRRRALRAHAAERVRGGDGADVVGVGSGGRHPTAEGADATLLPFDELYDAVGFNRHYAAEERYDPSRFADWERTRGSDGA